MKNMTELADKINSRFGLMQDQFDKYDKDVASYMKYLKEVTNKRLDDRIKNNADSSEYARSQKEMLDKVGNMSSSLVAMSAVVQNNHLIEQIKKYDDTIKENDKQLVGQDNALLDVLQSKNARDEYLSDDEAKHLMKQQVRKIMSKKV